MRKSFTNKLSLKQELYGLNMVEGSNLLEHLNVFNKLLDQLHKVDVEVEKEDKVLLLLTLFFDFYDNMVIVCWSWKELEGEVICDKVWEYLVKV